MKSITISVARPNDYADYADYDKIGAIKALRVLTGMGLKATKDAVDSAHMGESVHIEYEITAQDQQRFNDYNATEASAIEEIRRAGYNVVIESTSTINDLRKVAHAALDNGEFGLAVDIINLLQRHN